MRLIHTADGQLGKPFGRFPQEVRTALGEARFDAIDRIEALARERDIAHEVVAGDVFDSAGLADRDIVQPGMERQCLKIDKASGIVNYSNHYANETIGEPAYPLVLRRRVITVSLETVKIVRGLPALNHVFTASERHDEANARGR